MFLDYFSSNANKMTFDSNWALLANEMKLGLTGLHTTYLDIARCFYFISELSEKFSLVPIILYNHSSLAVAFSMT